VLFRTALEIWIKLDSTGEACDARAGQARACLKLGDLGQAMIQVEQLLATFQSHGMLGLDRPVMDLFTCYQVLAAARDPRARGILEQGYRLLQDCAGNLDPDQRSTFLENVSANRELLAVREAEWKS
jgi:hypothetical protein